MSEQNLGGKDNDPQFTQRFVEAIDSVHIYNQRHVGISGVMRSVIDSIMARIDEEPEHSATSPAEEAEMEKEFVRLLRTDELDAMGITLFDMAAPGTKKFEAEDFLRLPSQLFMLITDKDRFEDALWQLNPAPGQEERIGSGVASLLFSAIVLIRAAYPHRKTEIDEQISSEMIDAGVRRQLDMFIDLSPALVQQGFGESEAFKTLAEYSVRYVSGVLPEYREAESLNLLAEEGRFGPATWNGDMATAELAEHWEKAFDLLGRLRDKHESSQFFTELFNKLRSDFDTSHTWLETVQVYDDSDWLRTVAEYQETRANFEARLKESLDREPTFDELYGEGTPKWPESRARAGYPKSYVDSKKEMMNVLSSRWTELFPIENAYYFSRAEEDGDTGPANV